MRLKIPLAVFVSFVPVLLVAAPVYAQSTAADVTFAVPLNLTNLASDITKARVRCWFMYGIYQNQNAIRVGEQEIPVTARQVVTTAQVVVMLPATAIVAGTAGQSQPYTCELSLYSAAIGWSGGNFNSDAASASFRMTQAVSARTSGQFQW
jgi:hypothetical protein